MALPAPVRPTRSNYWRERTEQDLLGKDFTSNEPELLAGMSDAPPVPGEVVVEFAYDLRGRLSGKARCVHCKFPNHFKGFVIRLSDGSRRLVGKDCGRKIYGGLFDELVKDFKTAQELASSLRRRDKLLAAENILARGIEQLMQEPALWKFRSMARSVQYVLGRTLVAELQGIAKRGDNLTAPERVRDYAAEERSEQQLSQEHTAKLEKMNRSDQKRYRRRHNLPDGEIYIWLNKVLGPLKGTAVLESDLSRHERHFEQLYQDVSNCFGGLRQERRWSSITLSEASQRLTILVGRLEEEVEKLKAPKDFFELSHLSTLCEWALRRSEPVILHCGPGWLEGTNDYDDRIKAEYTADYQAPSTDFIRAFRFAIA